jgi:hypothetical protein
VRLDQGRGPDLRRLGLHVTSPGQHPAKVYSSANGDSRAELFNESSLRRGRVSRKLVGELDRMELQVREHTAFTFRAEAFNVLNVARLGTL